MIPRIVALTGYKGSGKDECASALMNAFGPYQRYAFAGPVKRVCELVFGLTWDEMENNRDLKEKPIDRYPHESPRQLMQKVGTDCFRALWPDIWVECAKRELESHPDTFYVITDMRFPNELKAMKELGALTIRIIRPGLNDSVDLHPSERFIGELDVDHEIINQEGDIANLHNTIRMMCGLGSNVGIRRDV